jgi:hypothetical protein
MGRQGSQQAFLSFFTMGALERFPMLRLGVLEVGCGWIGSFLDRMDAAFETISAKGVPLSMPPSEYFRRQCFISGDPDERAAPHIIDAVGPECFVWATDYPHPDHPCTWVRSLERFVAPLSPRSLKRRERRGSRDLSGAPRARRCASSTSAGAQPRLHACEPRGEPRVAHAGSHPIQDGGRSRERLLGFAGAVSRGMKGSDRRVRLPHLARLADLRRNRQRSRQRDLRVVPASTQHAHLLSATRDFHPREMLDRDHEALVGKTGARVAAARECEVARLA